MQACSEKAHTSHPFDALCLLVEIHQKAEDSDGFDLDASPDCGKLNLQFSEDAASSVVAALLCLSGERGTFESHASSSLQLQTRLQAAGGGSSSSLFLRNAHSPS